MPYIGYNVTNAGSFAMIDDISSTFNGSNTSFTLNVGGVNITPNTANLLIAIDGVVQQAPDAYTVSGSTINFTGAPASGADFYGILMGQSSYVENNSIGADELNVSGDGTSGQVLTSDGDGTFSWATDTEAYVPLAGGTMTGTLAMGSNDITGTGDIGGTLTTASQTNITSLSTALVTNGSAGSPSHSFSSNADSGMYSPADNQLAFASGGTQALIFGGDQSATFASTVQGTSLYAQKGANGTQVVAHFLNTEQSNDACQIKVGSSTSDKNCLVLGFETVGDDDSGNYGYLKMNSLANTIKIDTSNNVTFAGDVDINGGILKLSSSAQTDIYLTATTGTSRTWRILTDNNHGLDFYNDTGSAYALRFDTSNNATFTGNVTASGTSTASSIGVNGAPKTTTGYVDITHNNGAFRLWDADDNFGGGFGTNAWAHGGNDTDVTLYANAGSSLRLTSGGNVGLTFDTTNPPNATFSGGVWGSNVASHIFGYTSWDNSVGMANVQGSGGYGMGGGRQACTASAGAENIGKSHWGGISCVGFSGTGIQGMDIVAWGYGGSGATVLYTANWVGSLSRSYSTSTYHLTMDVGTDCSVWSILIGI